VHGRRGGNDLKKGRGVTIVNRDHSHMLEDRHHSLVSRIEVDGTHFFLDVRISLFFWHFFNFGRVAQKCG
jgi:hypothetical protein